MNPGYYSEAAVKDLLALKSGEIDYLKKQLLEQSLLTAELQHKLRNCKCACTS
jgi:hypothetical protein